MTGRRTFLKGAAAVVALQAFQGARPLFAAEASNVAGILYYTTANPGRWQGKAGGHAPVAKVEAGKISVETKHGMSEAHHIVRHTVMQGDGKAVGEKVFTPSDKPVSSFDLPAGFKGKLYVTSFCNLHDLWVTEITV